MKKFNTTTICIPSKHYMVDPSKWVNEIKDLVDEGNYFVINRARQYGKTTTLNALKKVLRNEYYVLSLGFQGIGNAGFKTEEVFVQEFCRLIWNQRKAFGYIPEESLESINHCRISENPRVRLGELFDILKNWCEKSDKPIVLIIDEVDSASNNQVFIDFLGQLRDAYILRDSDDFPTFHSVILAGVTDIQYLKSKIRSEDQHEVNSPWNVAAMFKIDMSLSKEGICGMLDEYEADHHTGMNTANIATMIRDYTNGYPFLVSRICQIIDKELVPDVFKSLTEAWTEHGVHEAVKILMTEDNTLFDSLVGKLVNYPDLNAQLEKMLLRGETIEYLPDNEEQKQLRMYGFIVNDHNTVAVSNKIFEIRLYKKYIGESRFAEELRPDALKHKQAFIQGGWLNVPLIMERFIQHHEQIWENPEDESNEARIEHFLEENGRQRFLTYLSPIVNGVGTYEIEPQTRDGRRMDIVIHYLGKRYIIELKIWHGEQRNIEGEKQIIGYLDYWNLDTGYMLSFNFNKKKERGVSRVKIGNKVLFEGTV